MAISFSAGDVLEHVELNNMVFAAKGWGVLDGLVVSQRAAGATMGIDVASGNALIDGTTHVEVSTVELTIEDAHATLHRKDLITYDPATSNPVVTKGDNHAGGTLYPIYPPDIPAGDILLAIVDVGAATTTIVDSDIHDCTVIVAAIEMTTLVLDSSTITLAYYGAPNYGSITVTKSDHLMTSPHNWELQQIIGGIEGQMLVLGWATGSQPIQFDAGGNLKMKATYSMNDVEDKVVLQKRGSNWYEITSSVA